MHKSAERGEPEWLAMLIQQHRLIRDFFVAVEEAGGESRRRAFTSLVRLLCCHETIEEEVVHPFFRGLVAGGAEFVRDRLAEEKRIKQSLVRLETMGPAHQKFPSLLRRLRVEVVEHCRHEEQHEFGQLLRRMPSEFDARLTAVLKAAAVVTPTHPHPGVESVEEHLELGPMYAVLDRMRDGVEKGKAAGAPRVTRACDGHGRPVTNRRGRLRGRQSP